MAPENTDRLSGYVYIPMPDNLREKSEADRHAALEEARKKAVEDKKKNESMKAAAKGRQQRQQRTQEQQQQKQEEPHVEDEDHHDEESEPKAAVAAPVKAPQQQKEQQQQQQQQQQKKQEEPAAQKEEPVAQKEDSKREDEAPGQAMVQEPTTTGTKHRSKTKHTVHFRGSRWEKALEHDRKRIEEAFRKDVNSATGLDPKRMESLEFTYNEMLFATFIVRHPADDYEMSRVHSKLLSCKFVSVTAIYPKK